MLRVRAVGTSYTLDWLVTFGHAGAMPDGSSRSSKRWIAAALVAVVVVSLGVVAVTRDTGSPSPERPMTIDAALASFGSASAYYLNIPGIPGDSTVKAHANQIDVQTFSWGVTNPTGTASFGNLNITKFVDPASPLLMKAVAAGNHVPDGHPVRHEERWHTVPVLPTHLEQREGTFVRPERESNRRDHRHRRLQLREDHTAFHHAVGDRRSRALRPTVLGSHAQEVLLTLRATPAASSRAGSLQRGCGGRARR